jgi:hypothetical protein
MTGVGVGTSVAGILGALLVTHFIARVSEITNLCLSEVFRGGALSPVDVRGDSIKRCCGLRQNYG